MSVMPSPKRAQGQILVIAALALVAIVGMVGLVIDGGALFAQQRVGAERGRRGRDRRNSRHRRIHGWATTRTNQNVYDAVNNIAIANDLVGWTAEYTNDFGQPLSPPVNVVAGAGPIPAGAEGVHATGTRSVSTTFSESSASTSSPRPQRRPSWPAP